MTDRSHHADQAVRATTTVAVIAVAGIAALVSYRHMRAVALLHGEDPLTAAVLPLSVDGLIITASMSLLADSRAGRRPGVLPWVLLILGSAASLAANMMHAQPTMASRLIAAWPPLALIGTYELLMRQIRRTRAETAPGTATESSSVVVQAAVPQVPVPVLAAESSPATATARTAPAAGNLAARQDGHERLRPATTTGPAARNGSRPDRAAATTGPAARNGSRPDRAVAEAAMREHWRTERAKGRIPSGAELDRVAGTRDYGRKVRRRILDEEQAVPSPNPNPSPIPNPNPNPNPNPSLNPNPNPIPNPIPNPSPIPSPARVRRDSREHAPPRPSPTRSP